MLNEYALSDLLPVVSEQCSCCAVRFEGNPTAALVHPYRQSFYSVTWFLQGTGFEVIDFCQYPIRKGRMFLVNPNQIIDRADGVCGNGYALMFAQSLASQLGIEFRKPYIDIDKCDEPLLQLVFEKMMDEYESENISKMPASIQYFYSLIEDEIEDEKGQIDTTDTLFRQFKEIISVHDFKIEPVDTYADALHVSTAALNDTCRDFSGSSAKQFLLNVKMTEAKRLLLYSGMNMTEISSQLGFEDSAYFARIFRKKILLSPTQFQKKYRKS
ncbi:MAG: helix-turn-helix domain-containing protein [Bacteroidales bacterium]|jgi:AraC-like DNA-binding protein|nr:helix-turn-helix domain-containing protein [Bacteroidales bacterium]